MSGFLGSGRIYVDRKVGSTYQGLKLIGNATKFEIKENSEKKERISKDRANYGSALNTVFVKKPAEVNITLDDLDRDNPALEFLGDSSAVSVTGATVTDEVVTGYKDRIFKTAKRKISSVVLTDTAGTTTYVADTDYEIVDADLGLIKVLTAGAITDAQSLKIDYAYGSMTSNKVAGGTNSNVIVKILFDGVNQADQSKAVVNVFEAVLSPTSGVDFLSDEFTSIELAGIANVPSGGTAAYEVELDVVYS
jgi:glycosyltransferase involved in cell wall biosynthesis